MLTSTLLTLLLLQPAESRVSLMNGAPRTGLVTAVTDSAVSLTEQSGSATIPIDDVMAIEFPSVAARSSEDTQHLLLTDGSQIAVSSITRNAKQTTATSAWLGMIDVSGELVHAIRLQPENPAFAAQWKAFVARESEKDLLIIAKRDGSGLDFLSGVVSSISAEQIQFLLDGDTIPVPAARAFGVVFGNPAAVGGRTSQPSAAVRLFGSQGDILTASAVALSDSRVTIVSGWSQSLTIPADRLMKIDLSGSRIAFLSELDVIAERFDGVDPENSLLGGLIDKEQQLALFGPRRDTTIERQSKLRLRGREYERGLCIHSRTEMSWALDRRYSSLACVVGIDDEVAFNGSHAVLLKVFGDDRVLVEQLIKTSDEPLPLSVSLDGVSTLKILVDFGDGDSVCDWLDLADAKLVIAKERR